MNSEGFSLAPVLIFSVEIPGRLPSWNQILGMQHWAARQVQRPNRRRFLVRVTSVRKRLLDEDNLCEKYHVDLCRYAGVLLGDEAGTTKIETGQRKAEKGETERTVIEIFEVSTM